MKVVALAKIFHGQMANPRHSTRNCPLGMVRYLGNSIDASEPNGIMLAAMFVPEKQRCQLLLSILPNGFAA